jgi:hypothetical protein
MEIFPKVDDSRHQLLGISHGILDAGDQGIITVRVILK